MKTLGYIVGWLIGELFIILCEASALYLVINAICRLIGLPLILDFRIAFAIIGFKEYLFIEFAIMRERMARLTHK